MTALFPDRVDVLIAGAGPAGLAAASDLVRGGASVVIADSRPRIGHPLRCAEATRRSFFGLLGVEQRPEWIRWTLKSGFAAYILNRPRMERDLAQLVARRGVIVREGTSVIAVGPFDGAGRSVVLAAGGTRQQVHARLVIAADGVASGTARRAGIDTRLKLDQLGSCVAYRVVDTKLVDPYSTVEAYLPSTTPGYFWVFPSGMNEANVGVAIVGRRGHAARIVLEQAMAQTPAFSGGRVVDTIVGLVPSAPPIERPYDDALLLCGAAARFVSATYGEGIYQAAVSGRAAAQVFLDGHGTPMTSERLVRYRESLGPLYRELYSSLEARKDHERHQQ